MRRALLGAVLASIGGVSLAVPSTAGEVPRGASWTTESNVSDPHGSHMSPSPPASVDLRSKMPPPINQGATGACTTYALVYAIGSYWAGRKLDPMPTYAQGLAIRSAGDAQAFARNDGISILQGFSTLQRYGAYPLRGQAHRSTWHVLPTTSGAGAFADMHVLRLGTHGKDEPLEPRIRTSLAEGKPLVLVVHYATELSVGFKGWFIHGTSIVERYHAVAAIGYVPEGVLILNSRGPHWGRGGYAVIPWDRMEVLTVEAYQPLAWTDGPATGQVSGQWGLPVHDDLNGLHGVTPRGLVDNR